jgi:hypothetical protein
MRPHDWSITRTMWSLADPRFPQTGIGPTAANSVSIVDKLSSLDCEVQLSTVTVGFATWVEPLLLVRVPSAFIIKSDLAIK